MLDACELPPRDLELAERIRMLRDKLREDQKIARDYGVKADSAKLAWNQFDKWKDRHW